jgi:predicted secreted protein
MSLRKRLFGKRDPAGKRVVALIECHLNQNVRDPGAARYPAVNDALLDLLRSREVGLLQIPCPEMFDLGLARARPPGESIREMLDPAKARELAARVADRIEEHVRHGMEVLAILGGDVQSPGCAVHLVEQRLDPEKSGVFMLELHAELKARGITIPFRGIRESDPRAFQSDLDWLARTVHPPGRRNPRATR